MYKSYGFSQSFGSVSYSVEGYSSEWSAKTRVYELAYSNGEYKLPLLREKWYQFWRQKHYSEIDQYLHDKFVAKII